jgi:SAM-dependent methyltransferase
VAADDGPGRAAGEHSAAAELARLYDLDMAGETGDIDLYLALARSSDGPILELACGSGRVCVPLAVAGHAVTGVDHDAAMLARARSAWQAQAAGARNSGALELVEADITTLDLGRTFALVVLALNGLLMLPGREAQLAALRAISRHLAPAGRAVIDAVLPAPDDLVLYDGRLELAWLRDDPDTGARVAKLWAARHEPATGVARIDTLYDIWPAGGGPVRRLVRSDEMHLLGAHELLDLAERAGLGPVTVARDHELAPFGPDSPRIVLVGSLL